MYDADGHIFENYGEIYEFLDPPFAGMEPLRRTEFFPAMDDWNRTILAAVGGYAEGSNTARAEEGAPQQWLAVLDAMQLDGTVLYPTFGMAIGQVRQKDWAIAVCRAYNAWLNHKYLNSSTRIKGMALIPTIDPQAAVAEMRRVADTMPGMVGFFISAGVAKPLGDAAYWPIFETAQELDMMIAVHAGGPGRRLDMMDKAIMARCLGHPTSQMIQMTHMMFSGTFDRFPTLRVSFMEAGIAWILFTLERMEEAYDQWAYEVPELKCRPIDHITGGRIYFHAELGERLLPVAAQQLGDGQLLYASDYPHIAPGKVIENFRDFRARDDLSTQTKQRILGENAKRLYKID